MESDYSLSQKISANYKLMSLYWRKSGKEKDNLFADYWETKDSSLHQIGLCGNLFSNHCQNACQYNADCPHFNFKYTTKELSEKYNLNINASQLSRYVEKNYQQRVVSICAGCGESIRVKSRSAFQSLFQHYMRSGQLECRCGYQGVCVLCATTLKWGMWTYWEEHGLVAEMVCHSCFCAVYNSGEEKRLSEVAVATPTKDELIFLSIFKDKLNEIIHDGDIDFYKLSFLAKTTARKSEEMYLRSIEMGWIKKTAEVEDGGKNHCFHLSVSVVIPDGIVDNRKSAIKSIIPSPLAQKTYEKLNDKFSYVFPEQSPAAFIDFNVIKDELSSEEKNWFFTKRIDFVCTDEEYKPVLAVEYNGSQHFSSNYGDSSTRKFKKNICELSGIPFVEINSPKQFHKIDNL